MKNRIAIFKQMPPIHLAVAALAGLVAILFFGFYRSSAPSASHTANEPVEAADSAAKIASTSITAPSAFRNITIKNFGQMDDHFYRGAQPQASDYPALAALGIKTIIDLRDDPTDYEKPDAEAAGMKYINIKMSDKRKPSPEEIDAFVKIAKDQSSWPFYVHCIGGRHRTGLIGAIYRFNYYGWDYDTTFKEMKNYDYYSRWGHGAIKDYVREYYNEMKKAKIAVAAVAPATAPASPMIATPADAKATEPVTAPPSPKVTD